MSTTAELVTLCRDRLGEDSTTATQVTDTQILKFLNQAMAELCADTDVLVSAWTTSTVSGQRLYSVPTEYTSVQNIHFYQTTTYQIWLNKVEIPDLDPTLRAGPPINFAVWGANVSGDNSPVFFLDPIPNTNGSSDLICYGRQLPKTMVSGGQGPEVRQRWQYAVVNGALSYIYLRLAAGDPSLLPIADRAAAVWRADKNAATEQAALEAASPRPARDTMGYCR